jgi:hypothetical protein
MAVLTLLYDSDTWPTKNKNASKTEAAEIIFL